MAEWICAGCKGIFHADLKYMEGRRTITGEPCCPYCGCSTLEQRPDAAPAPASPPSAPAAWRALVREARDSDRSAEDHCRIRGGREWHTRCLCACKTLALATALEQAAGKVEGAQAEVAFWKRGVAEYRAVCNEWHPEGFSKVDEWEREAAARNALGGGGQV